MSGLRRLSIHTRLFLGFGGVLVVSGALMVAAVYLGMRYLPSYDLGTTAVKPGLLPDFVPGPPSDRMPAQPPHAEPHGSYADTQRVRSKEDVWATVLTVSVAGAALVALLGLAAGWLLSRRLLAPLHTINRAAARAGEGDLSYRINAQGPNDELRQLADTFDETLAQLERSFAAHQRFAANASHELLTPLAATRTALQLAETDESGRELARLAPQLAKSNDRSIEIVHGLLQLAGAEHALPDTEPVDLAELVAETCGELLARARSAGIAVESDVETGHPIAGNAALLRRLVHNLLDNALTHNVPDGWAHVSVYGEGPVTLEVTNSGPRVDADRTERLFEPFHRAESRVRSDRTGHGLGLAIARAVVRAHHGTITATANADGGLTVRADFPGDGWPGPNRTAPGATPNSPYPLKS
ncbi:Signal transduction histidine-protein kinase BaeS [Streptomyces sp. YIM 130001]|uniref:sensor histidine kinase n=1 Tax=Streptomyces sp. YIM 130001 TaxID=2259644 RepID=UPI000EB9F37B|nr:HAMP domain-containing sensor histidine kinase [Streptomyces sp. YIM 130001]RII18779.1 Signal transduction histidine-protein kinase BaeS [Streptomyces sp. YIM 130001]